MRVRRFAQNFLREGTSGAVRGSLGPFDAAGVVTAENPRGYPLGIAERRAA